MKVWSAPPMIKAGPRPVLAKDCELGISRAYMHMLCSTVYDASKDTKYKDMPTEEINADVQSIACSIMDYQVAICGEVAKIQTHWMDVPNLLNGDLTPSVYVKMGKAPSNPNPMVNNLFVLWREHEGQDQCVFALQIDEKDGSPILITAAVVNVRFEGNPEIYVAPTEKFDVEFMDDGMIKLRDKKLAPIA